MFNHNDLNTGRNVAKLFFKWLQTEMRIKNANHRYLPSEKYSTLSNLYFIVYTLCMDDLITEFRQDFLRMIQLHGIRNSGVLIDLWNDASLRHDGTNGYWKSLYGTADNNPNYVFITELTEALLLLYGEQFIFGGSEAVRARHRADEQIIQKRIEATCLTKHPEHVKMFCNILLPAAEIVGRDPKAFSSFLHFLFPNNHEPRH